MRFLRNAVATVSEDFRPSPLAERRLIMFAKKPKHENFTFGDSYYKTSLFSHLALRQFSHMECVQPGQNFDNKVRVETRYRNCL